MLTYLIFHVIHLSHITSINPVITDMNQSALADIGLSLGLPKKDSKNISRKNKRIRNRPAKLQSL